MRIESLKKYQIQSICVCFKKSEAPSKTIESAPKIRLGEVHVMPFLEKKLGHHHPMKPAGFKHVESEETRDWRFGREVIHFLYS